MAITISAKITVIILSEVPETRFTVPINLTIEPAATPEQLLTVNYPFRINVYPIDLNTSDPLIRVANQFLRDIIQQYIDEERELKTLLNYGEDKQSVILAYRYGNEPETLQLKLLQPVPQDISINTPVFLSREVVQTLIDKIRVRFSPQINATPFLRPKNIYAPTNIEIGKWLKNVTIKSLEIPTGSIGEEDQYKNISFEDQIFRKWYSYDFNSSELNIDFTDYNNFVFYGSAVMRLAAFKEKLRSIEEIDTKRLQFVANSFTGSTDLVGRVYIQQETAKLAKQKESIIRSFDRYDQFLYFTTSGSDLPYTASAYYADGGYEYNPISYWPKSGSVLYSVTSSVAERWYVTQSAIAQRFDEFNENNLVNTIPTYVHEDENSAAYITFVTMIGHFFDLIKPYIDQMPYIYDRNIDPNIGLSKDLVNEIAESVGFSLPTINSIYTLSDTFLGTEEERPRRDFTIESYKRLLHNIPFFAKAKGTRTALNSLLKTFGINEQLINVKETGPATGSYYVFDEFSTGLLFTQSLNNYIKLPLSASNRNPRSMQFNLSIDLTQNTTIVTGDNKWALHAKVHPTIPNLGRLELTSGSSQNVILSSSYQEIFGDELLNVSIRTYRSGSNTSASLFVGQTYGEEIIFTSSMEELNGANKFVPLWESTQYVYVGGSGSLILNNFDGTIDEVRLWGINLLDQMTLNTAFDPSTNAGNDYNDAAEHLYTQISFNRIDIASLPSIINESPYIYSSTSPSLTTIETKNTTIDDFIRYSRNIRQLLPNVGASGYLTSKVKVAPPPEFTTENTDVNGTKILSRTKSIVRIEQKRLQAGKSKVNVAVSPTEIINQNIIRNIGIQDINNLLGLPSGLYNAFDTTLETLKDYYSRYYYIEVNVNRYIRVLSEINSVLNQVIDYFIPSKAAALKGVVIESSVLDKVQISPLKNLRVYGGNTRKTLNARGSLTGSKPDYTATFNLSQKIQPISGSLTEGSYPTIKYRHEDWHRFAFISQSLIPKRPIAIDSKVQKIGGLDKTYSVQHETWQDFVQISQSIKLKRSARFDRPDALLSGMQNTYGTQHESWKNYVLIVSESKKLRPAQIQTMTYNILSKYIVYETQHENWYQSILIASQSANKRPVVIKRPDTYSLGQYQTYNIQHETWHKWILITSGSSKKRPATIKNTSKNIFNASYKTYDKGHEDWPAFILVSQSIKRPRTSAIDTGLDTLNKVSFKKINNGSPGAEPYNRLYTRKLQQNEIDKIALLGDRVLYPPALYEIPPSADFRDIGVITYFNKKDGIYLFPQTIKTPAYREPINFESATTWSYGNKYDIFDVVYQQVDSDYTELGSLTGSALAGNGRYYVFTRRPSYVPPEDNTSYYLEKTPSYIPPSLDKTSWDLLRFTPIQILQPKRIVFDTFTIADPTQTNFKVTTIDINRITDKFTRYLESFDVQSIGSGSYVTGQISLQNIAALFAIQCTNSGLRLRLYRTRGQRDADIARDKSTWPDAASGVLLDMLIDQVNTIKLINPIVNLIAGESPPQGIVFYTINNESSTTKTPSTISLFYLALQIEQRVPYQYLPKHYKFFRDNSTATKRRNYLGCKFSIVGYSPDGKPIYDTIDGLPPIQVLLSEGNELNVSPTLENVEIQTGGGGTLNVT